ncbi:DUF547 domain-containing protein [Costertonia aggregata]|uniref:DUF547 domain-containing protein n=1 Tax=Costertonia aggregata TaxID=343403 RepID=A0A7H9AQR7_9FLAO|nr:DUF547 domain-containing protein [Costertonia aggregata]QLG45776.1 DUF547 domain-containing protein [Costertonia aggregata]
MNHIITLVSVLFLSFTSYLHSQETTTFFSEADTFLNTHVKNGRVDYKAIQSNPKALNELLDMARNINVPKDNASEYQAFWINGYNLLVIKNIVENYPLKSPLDVAGFFDKTKQDIGGKQITLNDIENKLLRGNFPSEARFHFVLVCAGLGCPPIINTAYKPSTLEAQLQKQTQLALNNPSFIQVNKNKVKISQIFEWYKGDFTQGGKSLVDYINQFRTEPLPENAKVSHYPYDWTLNQVK